MGNDRYTLNDQGQNDLFEHYNFPSTSSSGLRRSTDSTVSLIQKIRFLQLMNRERHDSNDRTPKVGLTKSFEAIANAYYSKVSRNDESSQKICKNTNDKQKNCKRTQPQKDDGSESETFEPDYNDFPRTKKRRTSKKKKSYKSLKSQSHSKGTKRTLIQDNEEDDETSDEDNDDYVPQQKKKRRKKISRTKSGEQSDCPEPAVSEKRPRSSNCKTKASISKTRPSSSLPSCSCNCGNSETRQKFPSRQRPRRRRKTRRSLFQRLFAHLGFVRKTNDKRRNCNEENQKVTFLRNRSRMSRSKVKEKECTTCLKQSNHRERVSRDRDSNREPTKSSHNGWLWNGLFGSSKSKHDMDKGCKCCENAIVENENGVECDSYREKIQHEERRCDKGLGFRFGDDQCLHFDKANDNQTIDFNSAHVQPFGEFQLNHNNVCPLHSNSSHKGIRRHDNDDDTEFDECDCTFCPFQFGDDLELRDVKVTPMCAGLISNFVFAELAEMLEEKLNGVEEMLQEEEREFWAEYIDEDQCPLCTARYSCELHR